MQFLVLLFLHFCELAHIGLATALEQFTHFFTLLFVNNKHFVVLVVSQVNGLFHLVSLEFCHFVRRRHLTHLRIGNVHTQYER